MEANGGAATEHGSRPPQAASAVEPLSTRSLLRGAGPRFARDAFGPVLAFYVGARVAGVVGGIVLSTVVSLLASGLERARGRPGLMARLSLAFVILNAAVGVVSKSASLYLALPAIQSAALGVAFLLSAAAGRPLTGLAAQEMRPIPAEVVASRTYRRVFGKSSIVWGIYLLARSGIRLLALGTATLGAYVVANVLTGVPFAAALTVWSIRDGVRGFRRSGEWGPAIAQMDDGPGLERRGRPVAPSPGGTIAATGHGSRI